MAGRFFRDAPGPGAVLEVDHSERKEAHNTKPHGWSD